MKVVPATVLQHKVRVTVECMDLDCYCDKFNVIRDITEKYTTDVTGLLTAIEEHRMLVIERAKERGH